MLLFTFAAEEALDTLVTASLSFPGFVNDVLNEVAAGSRVMSNSEDIPDRVVLPSAN